MVGLKRNPARKRLRIETREKLFLLALIMPSALVLMGTIGYPLISAVRLSFQRYLLTDPAGQGFIGFLNFQRLLFEDRTFWISFLRTMQYSLGVVSLSFLAGFGLALLLNQNIQYRGLFRSLFFLPWVVPYVVVSLLFMWIYNANYGVLNVILVELGAIDRFRGWITEPSLAMPSVIMATGWKLYPFFMLMLLAALQTIPLEQYEAASIDGAGIIRRFLHVTWPNVREICMITTLLEIIWGFQNFTLIWVLTKGGPVNATNIWPVHIYETAFRGYNMGYASAMGVIWLVFLLVFSLVYIRVVGGREEERA